MAAYQISTISLGAILDRSPAGNNGANALRNRPIDNVTILELPAGSNVLLHVGEGREGIPLLNQGINFEMCPAERGGLFVSVPVVQAGQIRLLISFEEGGVRGAT